MTAEAERTRIADWLDARAARFEGEHASEEDVTVALELSIIAGILRANEIGPDGMASTEPLVEAQTLRFAVGSENWNELMRRTLGH